MGAARREEAHRGPRRGALLAAVIGVLAVAVLAALVGAKVALAGSDLFTVSGVKVDVSDKDAATAKKKAIREAQMKAFHTLMRRIADEEAWTRLSRLGPRGIGRMMASLSIEEEHTGPRRYIGRLTVRFRPGRVRKALRDIGKGVITEQAGKTLIVPLWLGPEGPVLWRDNPWRDAWASLPVEHALVPVMIPAGDLTDEQTITAREALEGDKVKLEALRLRYDADAVLVAVAEPKGENSVHAVMSGNSPVGRLAFDKTYVALEGGLKAAAEQAARRFHAVMTYKWKKKVAEKRARERARRAAVATRIIVIVPFSDLRQWQALRARLASTPGVAAVDVSTLSGDGAVVTLKSALALPALREALRGSRMMLEPTGDGRWVLRVF